MGKPPVSEWMQRESGAHLSNPKAVASRTTRLERTVRIRNLTEYSAGTLVALLFAHTAWKAARGGDWLICGSYVLLVVGVGLLLWNLFAHASNLPRRPEQDCRQHLRAQLDHQRRALASAPRWYVLPLVPGMVLNIVAQALSLRRGTPDASFAGLLVSLAITAGVLGFVLWLNHRGAKRLADRMAKLGLEGADGRG
jgi:hypothetical protein